MAIEDAHELACSLGATVGKVAAQGQGRQAVPVRKTLKEYQKERILRVAAIHGMAGMAAFMASTYKVCACIVLLMALTQQVHVPCVDLCRHGSLHGIDVQGPRAVCDSRGTDKLGLCALCDHGGMAALIASTYKEVCVCIVTHGLDAPGPCAVCDLGRRGSLHGIDIQGVCAGCDSWLQCTRSVRYVCD